MRISNSQRHPRTALVLVAAISVFGAASCLRDEAPAVTTQLTLQDDMRRLWTEHALWTRMFLIDSVAGLPGANAAAERLWRNQVEIGDAIRPFYGDAAGDRLTSLMQLHVAGVAAVVSAAKAGDSVALSAANAAWYDNAHDVASFLSETSPRLSRVELDRMLAAQLDRTELQAMARVHRASVMDAQAYDATVAQALEIADALSSAIAEDFPGSVAVDTTATQSSARLHRQMRALWQEHVGWSRVLVVVSIAGLPDTATARARLGDNQAAIGDAFGPYYGPGASETLSALLDDHVTLAARVVLDAKARNVNGLSDSSELWYANADRIAAFFAAASPSWPFERLRSMLRTLLDRSMAQVTSRLAADWSTDTSAYDAVEASSLELSDVLADGIVAQFPERFAN